MVETPRLSSLAGELFRFFFFSSLLLGVVLSLVLFFTTDLEPYYALGVGFGVALIWVTFNILWVKNKMEEIFSRLLYVIDILEERHTGKAVVPIPIHEEILEVVGSIKELVDSFERKYQRDISNLEEQLESVSENTSKLLASLEKVQEGHMNVEFPKGLDPIGAIGQAIEHTLMIYKERFNAIRENISYCSQELDKMAKLLREKGDKIELREAEDIIERLKMAQAQIEKELSFIKVD